MVAVAEAADGEGDELLAIGLAQTQRQADAAMQAAKFVDADTAHAVHRTLSASIKQ
ncbi:MAG TPA: hypothetical protein PK752_19990 [Accumulibacter sp.]|uniref:hypothetical protein n=1 Tax=Accumulibacter sp. TaxID=2053492 RepID=UPI002C02A0C6|nr:hypothetical protein [Accumulibacter sp.]HRD90512.1 hypothetical protein [Accumulibacter sp.]